MVAMQHRLKLYGVKRQIIMSEIPSIEIDRYDDDELPDIQYYPRLNHSYQSLVAL